MVTSTGCSKDVPDGPNSIPPRKAGEDFSSMKLGSSMYWAVIFLLLSNASEGMLIFRLSPSLSSPPLAPIFALTISWATGSSGRGSLIISGLATFLPHPMTEKIREDNIIE